MPYIPQDRRRQINNELTTIGDQFLPQNAGDLNYLVSRFIDNYLVENGIRYAHCNEMIGALECCKLELYRRMVGPYEDDVIDKNGDAYFAHLPPPGSEY